MNEYSNLLPLKQILIFALFVVALLIGTGIQFPNYSVVLNLFGPLKTNKCLLLFPLWPQIIKSNQIADGPTIVTLLL